MRIVKWLLAALVLLLAIALVVAWTFPAGVAWRWAAPRLPGVTLTEVGGSIWHGHAAQVSVAGQPLGALEWRTGLLPLLHGAVELQAQVHGDGLEARGTLTRTLDGALLVHGASIDLAAPRVRELLALPRLRFDGPLHVDIRAARIRHAWFEALDASGRWQDVTASGAGVLELGTLEFSLAEARPPVVTISIGDAGDGPIIVDGSGSMLPVGYTLDATLKARNPGDLRVQEALGRLGPRQADGSVVLHAEGRLALPAFP